MRIVIIRHSIAIVEKADRQNPDKLEQFLPQIHGLYDLWLSL